MDNETPNRLWLPRTGQVTSYADGDDGYYQAGNPRVTRFVDNGNGTVSDRATGLMWDQDPSQHGTVGGYVWGTPGTPAQFSWTDALLAIAALNANGGHGGYTDWRLPNLREGLSIRDEKFSYTTSYPTFFLNAAASYYWSSTTPQTYTTYAVCYRPFTTNYPAMPVTKVTSTVYARPVRGGRLNSHA